MNMKNMIREAISENFDHKDEILSNVLKGSKKTGRVAHSRSTRLIAIVAAVVLTMTITVTAIVLNRSVEFSLVADKSTAVKGDQICITATAKNMTDFVKGIYGFTVDVDFDNTRFDFDNTLGVEAATGISNNFIVKANLSDADTVTVLFYAADASGELSFLDKNVEGNTWDIFKLHFIVKDSAAAIDGVEFTPVDCKIADAAGEGTGFDLVENVTLAPAEMNISALQRGDVNGDGQINIRDLVRFKKYAGDALGELSFIEATADCDRSGKVESTADMICLKKFLLNIIAAF